MKDYQFDILVGLFEIVIAMILCLATIVIETQRTSPDFSKHRDRLTDLGMKGSNLIVKNEKNDD